MIRAVRRVLLAAGLPLALLGLWWLASADSQSFYLPPLRDILAVFGDTWLGGRLADDVLPSVARLLAGLAGPPAPRGARRGRGGPGNPAGGPR